MEKSEHLTMSKAISHSDPISIGDIVYAKKTFWDVDVEIRKKNKPYIVEDESTTYFFIRFDDGRLWRSRKENWSKYRWYTINDFL